MIYAITLGFVPARIFEKSMKSFYTHKTQVIKHIFVDQHYPINKNENKKELVEICKKYGLQYLDPGKNLGLHGGFNWAVEQMGGYNDDDYYIGFDPDSFVLSAGWDMALLTPYLQRNNIGWTSLFNQRSKEDIQSKPFAPHKLGHVYTWQPLQAVMNSICMWSGKFLKATGGLHEPLHWYGLLECDMFERLKANNMEWHFLCDWWEDDSLRVMQDEDYKIYKWEYAHMKSTTDDFETWLKKGKIKTQQAPEQLP